MANPANVLMDLARHNGRFYVSAVGQVTWLSNTYFAYEVGPACVALFKKFNLQVLPGVYVVDDTVTLLPDEKPVDIAKMIPEDGEPAQRAQVGGPDAFVRLDARLCQAWQVGGQLVAVNDEYMVHVEGQVKVERWTQQGPAKPLCGWKAEQAVAMVMPVRVSKWDQ